MTQVRQLRVEHSPVIAEILPGVTPSWHVARCIPGTESPTALHLAGRRVGVYLPVADTWQPIKGRGDQVTKQTPLFPGYLFVFVWGLAEHLRRVRATPGVSGFLLDGLGIPVTVPDSIIEQIQKIEWKNYLSHLPRSFFRRRQQNEHWIIPQWSNPNHGFADSSPAARTSALHMALGLGQSPAKFDKTQESIPISAHLAHGRSRDEDSRICA